MKKLKGRKMGLIMLIKKKKQSSSFFHLYIQLICHNLFKENKTLIVFIDVFRE